jgi:glycosyltransferase involved in cell wall biosynthesis
VPIPISAVVLTRNEEENLPDCLASLAWADELLVVDSFSTDKTVELARSMGARVVQHPFRNFAAQRNFAQAQARHDWVLFIDADERVSPELRDTICELARSEQLREFNGYYLQRVQLFSGRWWPDPSRQFVPAGLRAIEHYSPHGMLRLLDRRLGTWTRALHEVAQIPRPHGVLRGALYHYSTSNLSLTCEPFNSYTDLEAAYLHLSRSQASLGEAVFRGLRSFFYHYFFGGFYRYGQQGFLMAIVAGYTKFMNYAKLWERIRIQSGQGIWTERDRKLLERFNSDSSTGGHE